MMPYFVSVIDFESLTVQKRSRPCATMKMAEKIESGMLINLNLEKYYTRIDGEFAAHDTSKGE